MITKFTDEELKTVKLRDITSVIGDKLTAEEKDKLKVITSSEERRDFIVKMYNKYIDAVIAESDEAAKKAAFEAAKAKEEKEAEEAKLKAAKEASKEAELPNVSAKTDAGDVNTSISFTAVIRGATGYNGTVTITCDHLLVVAFRNPHASIVFRNSQRAMQFINIVKNVKHVKGVSTISDDVRNTVINRVKQVNGIK